MLHPAQIGRYEVHEFLGGVSSHVYRAYDAVLHREVALKILTAPANANPDLRDRFLQEIRIATSLSHPNLIPIYDFGEDSGCPCIVMEFLRGELLREALRREQVGDLKRRLSLARQIVSVVAYIHSKGIIHRDLKPDNLFLVTSGQLKLMDFGIAKMEGGTVIIHSGYLLGSPHYIAPEQVLGQRISYLADIYAFGVILYEMVSGKRPIDGETVEQILLRILHEEVSFEPLLELGVPERILLLIQRCMAKNPEERLQDWQVIDRELDQTLNWPIRPARKVPRARGLTAVPKRTFIERLLSHVRRKGDRLWYVPRSPRVSLCHTSEDKR